MHNVFSHPLECERDAILYDIDNAIQEQKLILIVEEGMSAVPYRHACDIAKWWWHDELPQICRQI